MKYLLLTLFHLPVFLFSQQEYRFAHAFDIDTSTNSIEYHAARPRKTHEIKILCAETRKPVYSLKFYDSKSNVIKWGIHGINDGRYIFIVDYVGTRYTPGCVFHIVNGKIYFKI